MIISFYYIFPSSYSKRRRMGCSPRFPFWLETLQNILFCLDIPSANSMRSSLSLRWSENIYHSVSSQADILKFSLSKCSEAQLTWTEKKQEFTWTQLQRPETQVQVWKKTNRKYTSQPRNHKSLLESSTQFMFKG